MKGKIESEKAFIALKAFKRAVKKELDFRARMEVPSVFMRRHKICYRMPDGTIKDKPE